MHGVDGIQNIPGVVADHMLWETLLSYTPQSTLITVLHKHIELILGDNTKAQVCDITSSAQGPHFYTIMSGGVTHMVHFTPIEFDNVGVWKFLEDRNLINDCLNGTCILLLDWNLLEGIVFHITTDRHQHIKSTSITISYSASILCVYNHIYLLSIYTYTLKCVWVWKYTWIVCAHNYGNNSTSEKASTHSWMYSPNSTLSLHPQSHAHWQV